MNRLFLNKSIYDKKYILIAIQDYCRISKIKIEEQQEYYICIFEHCIYDTIMTIKEFENYLIGITRKYDL